MLVTEKWVQWTLLFYSWGTISISQVIFPLKKKSCSIGEEPPSFFDDLRWLWMFNTDLISMSVCHSIYFSIHWVLIWIKSWLAKRFTLGKQIVFWMMELQMLGQPGFRMHSRKVRWIQNMLFWPGKKACKIVKPTIALQYG